MRKLYFLLLLFVVFCSSCKIKEDPKPSCIDPLVFELVPFTTVVVDTMLSNGDDSGTFWVCNGGHLTISGIDNLILIDSGGVVIIEGKENDIYNLEGGRLTLNGKDNEAWLNGDSRTYVYGFENQLFYYWAGQLYEYGEGTYVDELCANVEVDFRQAPAGGCR